MSADDDTRIPQDADAMAGANAKHAAADRDARAGQSGGASDVTVRTRDESAGAAATGGDGPAAASGGSEANQNVEVACVPIFVQASRGELVQLRCQKPITLGADQVEYLALPTMSQQATCSRFSELASSALLRATPIGVSVNATGRGNDSGCEAARCRTILGFFQEL